MTVWNILSVDLEDWFHICDVDHLLPSADWDKLESRVSANTRLILDILEKRCVTATFFVLGYIADRHPRLIRDIVDRGHDVAVHGYGHLQVYRMTPDQFRLDLRKALRTVSALTGQAVSGFRAPEWSIRDDSLWALDILLQEGLAYDSSMAPLPIIGNPRYPRIPHRKHLAHGSLWEIPPLVAHTRIGNYPLGGGWGLRVFPYALIRKSIRKLNADGYPAVIYLHPREFDRNNPPVPLPLAKRFVVGARFASTRQRLLRLLDDFQFTSMKHFLDRKDNVITSKPTTGP